MRARKLAQRVIYLGKQQQQQQQQKSSRRKRERQLAYSHANTSTTNYINPTFILINY